MASHHSLNCLGNAWARGTGTANDLGAWLGPGSLRGTGGCRWLVPPQAKRIRLGCLDIVGVIRMTHATTASLDYVNKLAVADVLLALERPQRPG